MVEHVVRRLCEAVAVKLDASTASDSRRTSDAGREGPHPPKKKKIQMPKNLPCIWRAAFLELTPASRGAVECRWGLPRADARVGLLLRPRPRSGPHLAAGWPGVKPGPGHPSRRRSQGSCVRASCVRHWGVGAGGPRMQDVRAAGWEGVRAGPISGPAGACRRNAWKVPCGRHTRCVYLRGDSAAGHRAAQQYARQSCMAGCPRAFLDRLPRSRQFRARLFRMRRDNLEVRRKNDARAEKAPARAAPAQAGHLGNSSRPHQR